MADIPASIRKMFSIANMGIVFVMAKKKRRFFCRAKKKVHQEWYTLGQENY